MLSVNTRKQNLEILTEMPLPAPAETDIARDLQQWVAWATLYQNRLIDFMQALCHHPSQRDLERIYLDIEREYYRLADTDSPLLVATANRHLSHAVQDILQGLSYALQNDERMAQAHFKAARIELEYFEQHLCDVYAALV